MELRPDIAPVGWTGSERGLIRFCLVSGDRLDDFPAGGIQSFPVTGPYPLVRLKIFIVLKKVLDLIQQHVIQVFK